METKAKTPKMTLGWLLIVLNCAAGMSAVLNTGWLFSSYYQLTSDACALSAAQMGVLLSITDGAGIIGYVLGGFLADAWRPKACIVIGSVGMIALSFWGMTIPGYQSIVVICTGLVIFGIVFYWGALIRYVTNFGPKELQGKAIGFVYGFSGAIMLVWGTLLSANIAKNGSEHAFRWLLLSSILILIVTTIAQIFYDKEPWFGKGGVKESTFSLKMIGIVLANKRMWVVYLIAMLSCASAVAITYLQPLLADFYGCSTATITMITTWVYNVTLLVMSFVTGFLIDKFHSAAKVVILSFLCLLLGVAVILFTPWIPALVAVIIIAMILVRCVNSICKPGRVAFVAEAGVPEEAMGTATGLMFAATTIPGTIMYSICGNLLTKYDGTAIGYRMIYIVFIVVGILGILAVQLFRNLSKKEEAKRTVE